MIPSREPLCPSWAIDNLRQLWRALGLVWESAPGWTLSSAVLIVVQGSLPLASLYLIKLIVDAVTISMASDDEGAALGRVLLLIALAGGVALVVAICRSLSRVVMESQSALVSDHVHDILHAKSVEVDLEYYENSRYYDTLHRAQREAPTRPIRIVTGLSQVFQNMISLFTMVGLLLSLSWALALVLVLATVPGAMIRFKYADELYRWQRSRTTKERRAWYLHWILTGDAHAKEIRLYHLGPLFMDWYRDLRRELREERMDLAWRRSLADLSAEGMAVVAVFGSLAYIAHSTLQGSITLGDMVMYFGAFQQGQNFLRSFLAGLAGLYEDNLFLSTLEDFLDMEPKVLEPSRHREVPRPITEGITFEHVGFSYPGSNKPILVDVSLRVRAGQKVALVGENGSGKTTLVKLLCRLYDPDVGRIALDGIDLRDFRTVDIRREIGVIFQDYARYNLTARENIWLGDAGNAANMEDVVKAAKVSGADGVISRLDRGYETVLGRWFDDGVELSVGEWQKVALARAFLRPSQVIILDEPTNTLDPKAEEAVFSRFEVLARGKTAILISHRLSTVTLADRIYFLKGGRVVEEGTHQELMASGGEYARLFEIQARRYR